MPEKKVNQRVVKIYRCSRERNGAKIKTERTNEREKKA